MNQDQIRKICQVSSFLLTSYLLFDYSMKMTKKAKLKKIEQELKILNKEKKQKLKEEKKAELLKNIDQNQEILLSPLMKNQKSDRLFLQSFNQKIINSNKVIHKIVVTGGPCAGKTTGLAYVSDLIRDRGFEVFVIPECATQIAKAGGLIQNNSQQQKQVLKFQTELLKMQISLEDTYQTLAQFSYSKKQVVILCDRGVMDGFAYMEERTWQAMLERLGLTTSQLRDNRYDAVIHLVTAADGAEEFYNFDNHYRYETDINTAKQIDKRLQYIWAEHNNQIIIDNSEKGFQVKIDKLSNAVLCQLNQQDLRSFSKKFLIKKFDIDQLLKSDEIYYEKFIIFDTYLKDTQFTKNRRIIKSKSQNSCSYMAYETRIHQINIKDKVECRKRITAREYTDLLEEKDQKKQTLIKSRIPIHKNNNLYRFEEYFFQDKILFMTVQIISQVQQNGQKFLEFFGDKIIRDITDDFNYQQNTLAQKNWVIPQEDLIKINS